MENGQILCTKTETGHLLHIGYRFEMPCGKCIQNITTSFYFTSTERNMCGLHIHNCNVYSFARKIWLRIVSHEALHNIYNNVTM